VKKIIFWGDGFLAGSTGYAETLSHHIFLHHPQADIATSIYGGGPATWQDAVRDAPLHVIGKAPDLVILGFGSADLAQGRSPAAIMEDAQSGVSLMLQKTQSHICLISMISSFCIEDEDRDACRALNMGLRALAVNRVAWIDLDLEVERFLEQHRKGPGEKHSLHVDKTRLTPLGRLFLAYHAYRLISWPGLSRG
jgi:hypothetical protein